MSKDFSLYLGTHENKLHWNWTYNPFWLHFTFIHLNRNPNFIFKYSPILPPVGKYSDISCLHLRMMNSPSPASMWNVQNCKAQSRKHASIYTTRLLKGKQLQASKLPPERNWEQLYIVPLCHDKPGRHSWASK